MTALAEAADLFDAALACLQAARPDDKCALTDAASQAFARGELQPVGAVGPLPIGPPGRPSRPRLVAPRELPQRGLGSVEGRAAFIHAIAHIEFNAIDLAWDAVYRFRGMPHAYYADWIGVAADEARHFRLLRQRLQALGHDYGDFDAHNGLWEMAEQTVDSCLERMALVPRVLEARGLDVTPVMISRLQSVGDDDTARLLQLILDEEVAHVAAGSRWFRWCCERSGQATEATFEALVTRHMRGVLRGPFNLAARRDAGFCERELQALQAMDTRS